jgi:hypothetical protein
MYALHVVAATVTADASDMYAPPVITLEVS